MTATLAPTADTWTIGAPRLLAGLDRFETLDLPRHLGTHGALPPTDRDRLIGLVDAIALAGRGGAGFPFAAKLRALAGPPRRVIVTAARANRPAARTGRCCATPHTWRWTAPLRWPPRMGGRHVTIAVHDPAAAGQPCAGRSPSGATRCASASNVWPAASSAARRAPCGGPCTAVRPSRRGAGCT